MSFKPSKFQRDILDFVLNGRGHLVVNALSGSGKTSTLVWLSQFLKADRVLYAAFNTAIVEEAREKFPKTVEVRTINSIGHGAIWVKNREVKLNTSKYRQIIVELLEQLEDKKKAPFHVDEDLWEVLDDGDPAGDLKMLCDFARNTLTDYRDIDALCDMVDHYDLDIDYSLFDFYHQALQLVLDRGRAMVPQQIDFNDQLWIPATDNRIWPKKFDLIMVDEAQDLSSSKLALVRKALKRGGRILFVGDRHQCQPAGTKVSVCRPRETEVSQVNIEDLQKGDQVVTFDRRSSSFVKSGVIADTASRDYKGELIAVEANGKETRCTPNHKWLVRWANRSYTTYCTYLMRQGDRFRVGQTRLFLDVSNREANFDFGLASRARQERASEAWVLKVHESYSEALAYEQVLAAEYGIPQVVFFSQPCNKHFTQDVIDEIFGSLTEQESRASGLLEDHGRDIRYPLYKKEKQQRQGRSTLFVTQACNLIDGYMAVPSCPDELSYKTRMDNGWEPLTLKREAFSGKVYSLEVAKHHYYVADGLVTHNSIYGFAGAKTDSVDNIIKAMKAEEKPLSICYRCDKLILDEVRNLVPEIEAREDAGDGIVRNIGNGQMMKEICEGDLILCRTNAPLLKLCFTLIADGVSAQIKGRDIGRNLLSLARKIQKGSGRDFEWKEFPQYAHKWGTKAIELILKTNGGDKEDPKIESIHDRVECLNIIWTRGEVKKYRDMEKVVNEIFSDARPSVWLSSVHRAKGLENDRVFIIRPDLLPGPWAKPGTWHYVQEENLAYVAKTRSKHELIYVHKDFVAPPADVGQGSLF